MVRIYHSPAGFAHWFNATGAFLRPSHSTRCVAGCLGSTRHPALRRPLDLLSLSVRQFVPPGNHGGNGPDQWGPTKTILMNYEARLSGGHPNSLGNTIEVVEEVLQHPDRLEALYRCYFSKDEVVRLRVSNAMKRIAQADRTLLLPYLHGLLEDVSQIEQASTKWTLAQLFQRYTKDLTPEQLTRATSILQHNLENCDDWIVQNHTLQTLAEWSLHHPELKAWLLPRLKQRLKESRKSVRRRAEKLLTFLS